MMRLKGVRISVCLILVLIIAAFVPTPWPSESAASAVALSPQDQAAKPQEELWQELDSGSITALASGKRPWNTPKHYRGVLLNETALADLLAGAPLETSIAGKDPQTEIGLPMPDGKFSRFRFVESPIMEPALAAQFPEIKTYRAWGIDDPAATGRFARTSGGFHAMLLSSQGASYIAPLFHGDTQLYASYYASDAGGDETPCGVGPGKRRTAKTEA